MPQVKKKSVSAYAGRAKVQTPSKAKSFFKYLLVVVISSVIAIFLFSNRHQINKEIEAKSLIVKEKVLNKPSVKKDKKQDKPASLGYDKKARESLDALINEKVE